MSAARSFGSLFVFALVATPTSAQLVFESAGPVASTPSSSLVQLTRLTTGDLNGDGDLDVIWSDGPFPAEELRTLLGAGDGSFIASAQVPLPYRVRAVGDVDGDGFDDVFAQEASGTELITVLGSHGDGTLSALGSVAGGSLCLPADVDGDGHLDVVSTTGSQHTTSLGAGDGTFRSWWAEPLSFLTFAHGALGDLDGDGTLDLAHAHGPAGSQAFYGLDGGVDMPTQVAYAYANPGFVESIEVLDIDADGDLDMLVAKAVVVEVLRNDGAQSFSVDLELSAFPGLVDMAVGDLDGDGWDDLAGRTAVGDSFVTWAVQPGGGGLGSPSFLGPLPDVHALHIGDVDDGGFPEVLCATKIDHGDGVNATSEVTLLRNLTYGPGSPFLDLGGAVAGGAGWPSMLAGGDLLPGGSWSFDLRGASPGHSATLVLGVSYLGLPFKGGVMVPSADLFAGPIPVGLDGSLALGGHWPGAASGAQLWAQWWIADAGGPLGWAASSGVQATVP
jgi:hypothetical protein